MARRYATRQHLLVAVAAGLSTLAASATWAAEPTPFRLEYTAPAPCHSRAQFLDELRARAAPLVEVDASVGATRFRVVVQPVEAGVEASIETTLLDGTSSRRVVRAENCTEAVAAAAVIVALVLPAQERPEDTAAQPLEQPGIGLPTQPEPPGEPPPRPTHVRAPPVGEEAIAVQVAAGGQLGTPSTLLGASIGGGVFGELTAMPDEWLAPSLRLAFLTQGHGFEADRGAADVTFRVARLSACPVRLPERTAALLRLCGLGELGSLSARGRRTEDAGEASILWSSLGASVRGVWAFPVVALELEAAAIFPLIRDRFVFQPEPVEEAFAVGALYASALMGVSVHLP